MLEYLIVDPIANAPMKEIPLQNLPTFHGLISEDPDAFLFKFDVLSRGYDYTFQPQKLKLFPSTLKGVTLCWFMGLGGRTINSWDEMKHAFLKKYQDYCRTRDLKDEIFQMNEKENETLEEYVERFQYNLQRSPDGTLPGEVLKSNLIKGMKDEWVEWGRITFIKKLMIASFYFISGAHEEVHRLDQECELPSLEITILPAGVLRELKLVIS
jgi:hypothetical protein